ncbi:SDR family NAD(P)-dependent oxidoreductase [Pseudochrobactrum sp. sp1633]|uniref:SDR family oxidoreductase n=1 Tax=Pseudochrobactrum sp. sp1633 TaxID=3036706 RepID=UPI0025A5F18D|nr:SDR family NAD(P)-dependent oxidoreductase [Pseudochrobactrum sp. sp1633]MDM8345276.1 SDR family NAD(P)-dependent oxidoreductase [Pseudochrobactrum sp. sp1633]HWD12873.1 SDR family NAD(P)-dependent oxidoreductase [Pseudochrobactrum sp.]
MKNLNGLTAVITGSGRGLGAALAMTLADAGCKIILCARNKAALSTVTNQIEQRTGERPDQVVVDLADNASINHAIAQITERYEVIDLLINNGAMWLEASDEPHSEQEVFGTINAAITGSFLFTQGLLPQLKCSSRPDIVTIGSISALLNAPLHSVSVPFYAAKHAQAALATGLQQMLRGTPVRSLCVHPPYLDDISPADAEWDAIPDRTKGERATNRDVCEAVMFAVTRPRHITLNMTIDTDEGGLFG